VKSAMFRSGIPGVTAGSEGPRIGVAVLAAVGGISMMRFQFLLNLGVPSGARSYAL
jgi:hypothetical protein